MKNRRFWVVALGVCCLVALSGPRWAAAQLTGATSSTTGSTCTGANNSSGFCGQSTQQLVSSGTTFQSRYAWNINADVGAGSTRDTSGNARHNVSFSATAPGWYRLNIATSRLGMVQRNDDTLLCNGQAHISAFTGSSNIALTSGSLSIAPGLDVNNGGGNNQQNLTGSSAATIDRNSNGVAQGHSLTFTWTGSVRSNSCEAAVRLGQQNGSTTGCGACEYSGSPSRTQANDGHFVTVNFTSFCGNGIIDGGFGEACDQGSANGSLTSCCNTNCTFKSAANTCRVSAGPCDPAENCTGGNANCPADQLSGTATVCRPAGGVCDVAENCTGSSPGCGFDFKQSSFTVCRGAGGVCDAIELCDGSTNNCPADAKFGSSTTCRGTAGVCDVAEVCDGSNNACPTDVFSPSTQVCRPGPGICDIAENCTGSAAACPANAFQPSTFECRASAGVCDLAENCTGGGATCPSDAKSTAECRASAGVCDQAEICNGNDDDCPVDSVQGAFVTCRPSAGVCDITENCDGVNVACPADAIKPSTTVCRGSGGVCDVIENCDGVNVACPADGFLPSTTICRPDGGQCDVPDNCTGAQATCPPDAFEPAGTDCTDNDNCTFDDECDGNNSCVPGINVNTTCDPCEHCDPSDGSCIAGPRTDCIEPVEAGKARVQIVDRTPDKGDLFVWKFIKGEATTLADFGNPTTTDGYTLCVFDDGSEVFRSTINPGGTCGTLPCWRALGTSGYKYINRDRTPDGILKTLLKSGAAGKAKIIVKGKGDNLPFPVTPFLPMATPVKVQLQNETPGTCWQTTHISTGPLINTIDMFKAVSEAPAP